MIKAIIFDCFGVLAEDGWLPFKRKYVGGNEDLAQAAADLGKQNEYGLITNDEYYDLASRLLKVDETVLRGALGKKVPNEELFEFINIKLKPHYKIGLLSNANYDVLIDLFTTEQAGVFNASVMSFKDKLIKPDPRMFQLIAERLDVELEECVLIDDVERYCVAAEAVGMSSILYENPTQAMRQILQITSP
ncbi:MAG: HAD-IA family hydrolase [bacterium]|nr:HAD-IA family hydrolase [bacterium]